MSELKSKDNMNCLRMIATQNGSPLKFPNRKAKGHENEVFFVCGQFTGLVCKSAQKFCKELRDATEANKLKPDEVRRQVAQLNFCQLSIDNSDWIPAIDIDHSTVKGIML